MGKKKMNNQTVEEAVEAANFDSDFEEVEETFEGEDRIEQQDSPSIFSEEWPDYVMSHFQSNELIDGNPICAGLRRVAELLLGDIVQSGPTEVFPAMDNDGPGRATVVFSVTFNWMNSGSFKTFSEVADVWHGNTDDLFCAHPVATASTRAEGRALRKALKIRCLAAEELAKKDIVEIVREKTSSKTTDGDWNPEETITVQQKNFVESKCKQLNIDVNKFINSGEHSYSDIEAVNKSVASSMIRVLNQYQNGSQEIPEEVM
jgi:hypothetical protein